MRPAVRCPDYRPLSYDPPYSPSQAARDILRSIAWITLKAAAFAVVWGLLT